jgi:hypothetical protein
MVFIAKYLPKYQIIPGKHITTSRIKTICNIMIKLRPDHLHCWPSTTTITSNTALPVKIDNTSHQYTVNAMIDLDR